MVGKVAAAVCSTPPEGAQSLLLENQELLFAVSKFHPLASAGEVEFSQLLEQPLVLVGEGTSLRSTILEFSGKRVPSPLWGPRQRNATQPPPW